MSKTIFITGASSGIGQTTAKHFHQQGWNVVATMRNPHKDTELSQLDNVIVTRLDVTEPASIEAALAAGMEAFGQIDVLLNNAGYGAFGPLEAFSMDQIRRQFDTNVIGLLATTKAVLPHFRKQRSGTIVNISSIAGKMTFPLGTLYHGSKFAVEGISEALHYELEPIGIKVKIVEPGAIDTDFGGRSLDFTNDESLTEYQDVVHKLMDTFESMNEGASPAQTVADVIWAAVNDSSHTLRYTAGDDAKEYMAKRQELDDAEFIGGIKAQMGMN